MLKNTNPEATGRLGIFLQSIVKILGLITP